jgi:potassium intermediate/small conductance calcium-activated channel subfamily N protein 2
MSNSCWNVIITLTTTGYGEFYPKTNFGRFIGLIICFWGTFIVSFFVFTVNNMLTFTSSEEKSYTLLQRLRFKEELKRYAVDVLSCAYKHKISRTKEPKNKDKAIAALRVFRGSMLTFQQAVSKLRNYYDGDSDMEILMLLVENLHE